MNMKILSQKDIPNIKKIQTKFNIYRVIRINIKNKLDMIEFFNENGVFRGFGKDSKSAYKKAKKALVSYYKEEN